VNIERHLIRAATTGAVLVRRPESTADSGRFLVGFHGYGENAERHLAELGLIAGSDRWTLAGVFALHRFYNTKTSEVVGSWMTRLDRDEAIADNLQYVNEVVGRLLSGVPTPTVVYAGFSQGVAMAYRAALLGAHPCAAVIALGGDVPPEFGSGAWSRRPHVLIGRGRGDRWYTADKLADDLRVLTGHGVPVEHIEFDGGHEWTDAFRARAGHLLSRLL
jgi:predicted esterase